MAACDRADDRRRGALAPLRIGPGASYWFGVLPAMIVIAVGMAGAVAPLTTAVLMSVDSTTPEPHPALTARSREPADWSPPR